MPSDRFDENKKKFMFTDNDGNILEGVNLVVVQVNLLIRQESTVDSAGCDLKE